MALSYRGCQRHQQVSFTTKSAFFCILVSILITSPGDVRAFHSSNMLVPSQVVSSAVPTSKSASNRKQKGSKNTALNLAPTANPPNNKNKNVANNCLIPSQVKGVSMAKRQQQNGRNHRHRQLPLAASSQDTAAPLSTQDVNQATKDSVAPNSSNGNLKKHPRRRRQQQRPRGSAAATNQNNPGQNGSDDSQNSSKTSSKKKKNLRPPRTKQKHARFGSLPDTQWGSIPMDHLRQHPSFVALPLPDDLAKLSNLEDVRNIRQDSWQWDALHDGRCTTSQAVAALGFLESKAGRLLEIPSTWQRRGIGAYTRLRQRALRTLDEMNDALLSDNPVEAEAEEVIIARINQNASRLWKKNDSLSQQGKGKTKNSGNTSQYPNTAFAAHYLHKISAEEKRVRARRAKQYAGNGMGIRMIWGDAQEPTSVLTALNYFTQKNPDAVVKEVGMCGAGLKLNQTDGSSVSNLLIGATPDGVIEYPDGSLEALEVKNHCPFVFARRTKRRNVPKKQYTLRELPFKTPYIFPLYVPQLMLEMLCLGPQCKSAVMVRQTATTGALILRIHRDDEWLDEMLYWLQRFQQDFVEAGVEPEPNFFFDSPEDGPRYRSFLESTKKLANKVDLVARVPHKSIQRSAAENSLFLD